MLVSVPVSKKIFSLVSLTCEEKETPFPTPTFCSSPQRIRESLVCKKFPPHNGTSFGCPGGQQGPFQVFIKVSGRKLPLRPEENFPFPGTFSKLRRRCPAQVVPNEQTEAPPCASWLTMRAADPASFHTKLPDVRSVRTLLSKPSPQSFYFTHQVLPD